jgi:transcriptional regulator with XRE-family HTH domain
MPYLSEVERGLKEASSEVLAAICRALEISVGDLVSQAHEEFSALRAFSGVHELSAVPGTPEQSPAASSSFDPGTTLLLAA